MSEGTEVEIFRRRLNVDVEGLTPMEISLLAQEVDARMREIANRHDKIADSSKLAILAALDFAAELSRVKSAHEDSARLLERHAEELTLALQKALSGSSRQSEK